VGFWSTLLSAQPDEGALGAVPVVRTGAEVPVAPIEALIHLKLKSPRLKDAADVIELLKAGIDRARCRAWLATNAPALASQVRGAHRARRARERVRGRWEVGVAGGRRRRVHSVHRL
jgi:hypothetical protein